MVLELHVPTGGALRDLIALWPTALSYFASYLFVAVYWVNHHQLIRTLPRVNYRVLWTNILWLFTLSVVPFFTAYVGQKGVSPLSVRLYTITMFSCASSFFLLRVAVNAVRCADGLTAEANPGAMRKHIGGLVSYCIAFAISPRWPVVSMAIIIGVASLYIVPDLGIRNRDDILG